MNQNKESQKLIVEFKRNKKELLTRKKTNNRLKRQLFTITKHNDYKRLNISFKLWKNRIIQQDLLDRMVYINAILTHNYPI